MLEYIVGERKFINNAKYLERVFVIGARRRLKGSVGDPIAESPSSGDVHTIFGGLLECRSDLGPCRGVRSHVHHPICIEPIQVE